MGDEHGAATLKQQVENALLIVRPSLQADGGDVELVDVSDEGVVSLRLIGACHGCPYAMVTLQMSIERILRERVPGITGVRSA